MNINNEEHKKNKWIESVRLKIRTAKKSRIIAIAVLCFLGIGIAAVCAAYYAPNVFLKQEQAYVDVRDDMTAEEIGNELQEKGLITHPLWFRAAATLSGQDSEIKKGEYIVSSSMSMHDLLGKLVSGKSEAERLVIPEGYTVRQIAQAVAKQGLVDETDFLSAAKDTKNLYPYMKRNGNVIFPTEGFLFPDTYFIPRDATAEQVVKMMLDNFNTHLTDSMKRKIAARNLSVYQCITLASLVEKEAEYDEDRPVVAAVFLKRLQLGMPLQSDASVSYVFGTHKQAYSIEETKADSPYNTYVHAGLPPGAIGNPGMDSINAVINAPATNYLFFVADAQGHNHFSATYEEHLQQVKEYMP